MLWHMKLCGNMFVPLNLISRYDVTLRLKVNCFAYAASAITDVDFSFFFQRLGAADLLRVRSWRAMLAEMPLSRKRGPWQGSAAALPNRTAAFVTFRHLSWRTEKG